MRADALEVALRGLAATNKLDIGTSDHHAREQAAAVLIQDTKIFIDDLRASEFRCVFRCGSSVVHAHKLRPLGDERALFDSTLISPQRWLELDYAEFHDVPQNAPQDRPHHLSGHQQLYVGSTKAELALSVHQLSLSFLSSASWELGYKPRL
jgi:hypothetical protein